MIYLIADEALTVCKIGTSVNAKRRIGMIQTSCPFKINLICERDGDFSTERAMHNALAQWRIRGEWFHYNQEVLDIFQDHQGGSGEFGEGYRLRGALKDALRDMVENNPHNGDYETWADNILYVMRDAASEFAGDGDAALAECNPDEYLAERPSITAWKAIIDMALWGKWK